MKTSCYQIIFKFPSIKHLQVEFEHRNAHLTENLKFIQEWTRLKDVKLIFIYCNLSDITLVMPAVVSLSLCNVGSMTQLSLSFPNCTDIMIPKGSIDLVQYRVLDFSLVKQLDYSF